MDVFKPDNYERFEDSSFATEQKSFTSVIHNAAMHGG